MKKGLHRFFLAWGPKFILYILIWMGLALVHQHSSYAQDDFDFDVEFEGEFDFEDDFGLDGEDWFDDFDFGADVSEEQPAAAAQESSFEEDLQENFGQDLDLLFDPLDPDEGEDALARDSVWDEFFAPEENLQESQDELLVLEPELETVPEQPWAEDQDPWMAPSQDSLADFDAPTADAPDYALEARLHQIFLNYNSRRISDSDWSLLLGGREVEIYEIQRGDTLWGISTTLFGDGNYWPKIWSVNAEITNPHLIRPGNSIRFIMGDLGDAPAFAITETEQEDPEMSTLASPILEADGEEFYGIEIPLPLEESRPVVRRLPPSLPVWDYATAPEGYDETGVDYIQRQEIRLNMNLPLPAYLVDKEPESIGSVIELELGGEQAGLYQYAYIAVTGGVAKPGDRLTVVRPRDRLRAPNSEVSIGSGPLVMETGGVVELVEIVDSRVTRSGQDMFRVIIVESVNPILPGSLVLREPLPRGNFARAGNVASLEGQIIGGVNDRRSHYFATHSIVFINQGEAQGLREADILNIRANPRVRNPGSIVRETQREIGQVKIIRLADNFSTALILGSSEGVYSGDFVGGEMGLAQLGSFESSLGVSPRDSFEAGAEGLGGFDDFNGFDDFDSLEGFDSFDDLEDLGF